MHADDVLFLTYLGTYVGHPGQCPQTSVACLVVEVRHGLNILLLSEATHPFSVRLDWVQRGWLWPRLPYGSRRYFFVSRPRYPAYLRSIELKFSKNTDEALPSVDFHAAPESQKS